MLKVDFSKTSPYTVKTGDYTDTFKGSRLQLRVRATGSRSWSVQFWLTTERRLVRWTLPRKRGQLLAWPDAFLIAGEAEGRYAETQAARMRGAAKRATVAEARARRAASREAKAAEREKAARPTLAAECTAWIRRERARLRPNTLRAYEAACARIEADPIGSVAVADLTRLHVVEFRDRVREKSGLHTANDTTAFASTVLLGLVDRGALLGSPLAGLKRLRGEKPRERTLSEREVLAVMVAAEQEGAPVGMMVLLALHTLARVSEVMAARWSEIDLKAKTWTLPAERNKSAREFVMPLSDGAMTLLKRIRGAAGSSPWLFPSERHTDSPISTPQHGMKRIAEAAKLETPWVFHDLRRTGRTLLSEIGVAEGVAELCLNHSRGGLVAVYDRHRFAAEKADAMKRLSARLAAIKKAGSKVTPISERPAAARA